MSNRTDILEELKELSSVLFPLKEKEQALFVPEHYFDQLADSVLVDINVDSGILSSIPKTNLEIPDGYFNNLESSVLSKIKADKDIDPKDKYHSKPFNGNRVVYLFSRFAAAAALVGIFIFGMSEWKNKGVEELSIAKEIEALSQEEIFQYISANSYRFSTDQIQKMVSPVIEASEDVVNIEIEPKEAEQYLEQNMHILDLEDASLNIF